MPKHLVVLFLVGACGSVKGNNASSTDAPAIDGTQSGDDDGGSTCGGAGQACCANNACSVGLACTPADQICRTSEMWIAAANGDTAGTAMIAHGNGTTFTLDPLGTGSPTAIWGTSASDVWVIVQGPNNPASNAQTSWARHWNGTAWGAQMNFQEGFIVYGLWGDATDNYWAVDNAGTAMHWNGTAWSAPQTISTGIVFTQVWGSSATDVWALGQTTVAHWDGSGTWTPTTRTDWSVYDRGSISGRTSGAMISGGLDLSVSTEPPSVLRRTGTQFTIEHLGDGSDCATTRAVWDGPDDAWALTAALFTAAPCDATPTVVHFASGTWTSMGKLPNAKTASAMWGTSNRDLFVAGTDTNGVPTLFHYDGTSWTAPFSSSAVTFLSASWGTGQSL